MNRDQPFQKQVHILNGDALKQQFPESITGEQIVLRECFVDGDVNASTLSDLFAVRAKFISQNYGGTEEEYLNKAVSEILKIKNIDPQDEIHLWFEQDLFCQVNMWFAINLLATNKNKIYLVKPEKHSQYGFGGLGQSQLVTCYQNKLPISQIEDFSLLWKAYQVDDFESQLVLVHKLKDDFPFLLPAIKAHIQRFLVNGNLDRPSNSILEIMKELNTKEFGPIFKEFSKRESIYGFGDLQVKRLYNEILSQKLV